MSDPTLCLDWNNCSKFPALFCERTEVHLASTFLNPLIPMTSLLSYFIEEGKLGLRWVKQFAEGHPPEVFPSHGSVSVSETSNSLIRVRMASTVRIIMSNMYQLLFAGPCPKRFARVVAFSRHTNSMNKCYYWVHFVVEEAGTTKELSSTLLRISGFGRGRAGNRKDSVVSQDLPTLTLLGVHRAFPSHASRTAMVSRMCLAVVGSMVDSN